MTNPITEDTVEYAAIEWLQAVGYDYLHGGDIAPEEPQAERTTYREVILRERAIRALMHINPQIPRAIRGEVIEGVVTRLEQVPSQNPIINNHHFHQQFVNGVDVSYRIKGEMVYDKVWLADFQNPLQNDWLAVNQFTVEHQNFRTQARTNRRPDIVLFMNGLPIGVVELKNASDENATVGHAFRQLQTYKDDIGSLFTFNGVLVVSDGLDARMGSLTAGWEWFKQWRTIDGYTIAPKGQAQLEILIRGALAPHVLLDLMRHFTVFDEGASPLVKKIAGYHQYHAVNKAVQKTIEASHINGDQRVGVVWHTQGSGKSLSMLFYAGKVVLHPDMKNPTLVVLTDRNDLDDQLFDTFAGGRELLRQDPVQAQDRNHLRDLLSVASGGVVFTTIQKFQPDEGNVYPTLSERRNIIFIADEAHRSQYGFDAKLVQRSTGVETTYGFAKYVRDALPHASFIGFTGTPVEANDANTPQVFGDYIDIYDIQRAVDDAATVPIYYEARLARIQLREDKRPQIDPSFEEVTEGQEDTYKEKLKTRWSQLEAMVGTEERLAQVARDMVTHFENRTETLAGKGMIVAMSRRIAVDLYRHIVELRPEWHTDDDDTGVIKVVMTGSASDPVHYQPHVRNKPRRKKLAERFKDPKDELRLVIVRDMWLTGFDAPSLHTMYIDKPMRGHNLMQAIARVNRVFRDKPSGLIVDYLGIAADLQEAVNVYTRSGSGRPAAPIEELVGLMMDEYGIVKAFFHRFDYQAFLTGTPSQQLGVIPAAMEHVLQQKDGKRRFMDHVSRLSKAFAAAKSSDEAQGIRDDVAFFQAIRSAFAKTTSQDASTREDVDTAVRQIVSDAVVSEGLVNIFSQAGLKTPDVSILSDEFLEDVKHLPHKNVAIELLRKLLNDEIKSKSRTNLVQSRSFAQMLEASIRRYQNQAIDAASVVLELIDLAKEVKSARHRGESLGLSEEEVAFYDALAENGSAVEAMGDKKLAIIATELINSVRQSVTIDWTVKQSARAKIRVLVKRILRRYGYPPDMTDAATDLVLQQAELLAAQWTR